MNKFNGVLKEKFPLHLKESEFRFNCRIQNKNMYNKLKKILIELNETYIFKP